VTRMYIDPPNPERCTKTITLRDGSEARCGRRVCDFGTRRCWQHPHREDVSHEDLAELRRVFAGGKDAEPEHFWLVVRVLDEVERRRRDAANPEPQRRRGAKS